jgi:hypothetical protein
MFTALAIVGTTVSSTQTVAKSTNSTKHAAAQKAKVNSSKAFLSTGTEAISDCEGPCGENIDTILQVENVVKEANEVEKKAEKAESDSKGLIETVAEIKAAKKEEAGEAAKQVAAKEKVEIVQEEVKKEKAEVEEKKKGVKEMKKQVAKIEAPEAKKVMEKEAEEEEKEEIKEEKVEVEIKKTEEQKVQREATIVAMKSVETQAETAAKEEKFKNEEKAVKKSEKLFAPEAIFKVKMAIQKVKKADTAAAAEAAAAAASYSFFYLYCSLKIS